MLSLDGVFGHLGPSIIFTLSVSIFFSYLIVPFLLKQTFRNSGILKFWVVAAILELTTTILFVFIRPSFQLGFVVYSCFMLAVIALTTLFILEKFKQKAKPVSFYRLSFLLLSIPGFRFVPLIAGPRSVKWLGMHVFQWLTITYLVILFILLIYKLSSSDKFKPLKLFSECIANENYPGK